MPHHHRCARPHRFPGHQALLVRLRDLTPKNPLLRLLSAASAYRSLQSVALHLTILTRPILQLPVCLSAYFSIYLGTAPRWVSWLMTK